MASALKLDTIKSTTGNTAMTITESGVPQLNVPAFGVFSSAEITGVTSTTDTKVQFDIVDFDSHGWFDATTNYRYQPLIAGFYQFNCTGDVTGTSQTNFLGQFYKNGTVYTTLWRSKVAISTAQRFTGSVLIELNGSTDYIELFLRVDGSANLRILSGCRMQGFLVRAA